MVKRICLQSGHKNITSGGTGASGERDWTTKIVPLIAGKLRAKGIEVYETDGKANNDPKVIKTDWDLFLAIHYDADIYNDTGGFVDFQDPNSTTNDVQKSSVIEAQRISKVISDFYFSKTGIKNMPKRSNANTRNYYMWAALTDPTPCVIIECGIGNRKPEDYNKLRDFELISTTLANAILKSFGIFVDDQISDLKKKMEQLEDENMELRKSRDKWKKRVDFLEDIIVKNHTSFEEQLKSMQTTIDQTDQENEDLLKRIKDTALEK